MMISQSFVLLKVMVSTYTKVTRSEPAKQQLVLWRWYVLYDTWSWTTQTVYRHVSMNHSYWTPWRMDPNVHSVHQL